MFILKIVKVLYFDALSEVLIPMRLTAIKCCKMQQSPEVMQTRHLGDLRADRKAKTPAEALALRESHTVTKDCLYT